MNFGAQASHQHIRDQKPRHSGSGTPTLDTAQVWGPNGASEATCDSIGDASAKSLATKSTKKKLTNNSFRPREVLSVNHLNNLPQVPLWRLAVGYRLDVKQVKGTTHRKKMEKNKQTNKGGTEQMGFR